MVSVQFTLRCLPDPGAKALPASRWKPPRQMMREGGCFIGVLRHDVYTPPVDADGPTQVVRQEEEINVSSVDEQDPRQEKIILDRPETHRLGRRLGLVFLVVVIVKG